MAILRGEWVSGEGLCFGPDTLSTTTPENLNVCPLVCDALIQDLRTSYEELRTRVEQLGRFL